jgi:hypothetical protein
VTGLGPSAIVGRGLIRVPPCPPDPAEGSAHPDTPHLQVPQGEVPEVRERHEVREGRQRGPQGREGDVEARQVRASEVGNQPEAAGQSGRT